MRMQDTSPEAERRYRELLRALGPTRRLEMFAELTNASHQMALAGLRKEHPDASPGQLQRALAERMYGPEVARLLDRRLPQS